MKVKLERQGEEVEVKNIFISIGEKGFKLTENNFGELVLNKHTDDENGGLIIMPSVSNEIRII